MKARLFLTAITALFTSAAFAGLYLPSPVVVDLDTRNAYGDLWSARFAPGEVEFIGCGVDSIDLGANGTFVFAFCQARDIDENLAFCFTENDSLIQAVQSKTDYSEVHFHWDEFGVCTDINISTQSYFIHKKLSK